MRAFLAIPVDSETTNTLTKIAEQLQQTDWGQRIIWFPPENYHLTLHFIGGKVDPVKIQKIADSMPNWFAEGMSHFEADVLGVRLFPTPQKPHTLVASLDATLLMQSLIREIEEQIKSFGFTPASRAFRPHISLGRIPGDMDPQTIHLPEFATHLQDVWLKVDRITLYESELTDNSPIYTPLAEYLLETYD